MEALLMRLALLFVGFLSMLGPLILLMGFLRHRERQESVLLGVVLKELNSPDLRGLFTVDVRCGLLSHHSAVMIDLRDCSKEQILDAILRISTLLPSEARLVVNGITDSRSRSTLTLNVKRSLSSVPSVSCCR